MTNFPPETYLAAARIAYPLKGGLKWVLYFGQLHTKSKSGFTREFFDPAENGNDYRALREALDKMLIPIGWEPEAKIWIVVYAPITHDKHIMSRVGHLSGETSVDLMLQIVEALIEAGGVVE